MKQEYNSSKGKRSKFYQPDTKLHLPVYLDDEVQHYLQERANAKGVEMSQLINEILKQDIKLIEAVK